MLKSFPLGSFENPVKCSGVEGEYAYLKKLVGPGGIPIDYQRTHGTMGISGKPVDVYKIKYEGLKQPLIVHFDMYAKGIYDKKATPGLFLLTDFLKRKIWQKMGYIDTVMLKEFGEDKILLPENYIYTYTKAGILLANGPYVYSIYDNFQLPLIQWDIDELMSCAEQMVQHIRGISAEHPIKTKSNSTAFQFLKTFHFETDENSVVPTKIKGVIAINGIHIITKQRIVLHFKI